MSNYKTILSVSVDCCTCNKLQIADESILPNDLAGHSVFGYRKIVVSTPNNTYCYSSLSTDERDEAINVLAVANVNSFVYNFQDTDKDGIYNVELFNFPLWDETVTYEKVKVPIVFIGGNLYKCIESNINVDPSTDTNNLYWELYEISSDTFKTRYATYSKVVVTCISLDKCYDRLVKEAFCEVESDGCAGLCENKEANKAMKFLITKKALCISEANKDWASVANQLEILNSLCCGCGC